MSLVNELLGDKQLEAQIESLDLIPSSGGRFEVTVNDRLIFSKKALNRHAKRGEVYDLVKARAN